MNNKPSPTIGRGAIWSFIENTARQFLALFVFLVTARFVSIEAFGIMAISLLIVEAFKQIVIDSVGVAITSISKPDDEDYNASFIIILVTSLLSAITVFVFADDFAALLGNDQIAEALRLICVLLAAIGLTRTHEAWLSRQLQFKILAIRSLISIILGGGIGIYLAIEGYGLKALIAQQLVTIISSTILLWLTTPWKPRFVTKVEKIKKLLGFSKHISATSAMGFANAQSDVFFSSLYLGEIATGLYNAAKRITTAMDAVLSTSLRRVALPVFANVQDDKGKISEAYLKFVLYTAMFTAPIFAGIAFLSEDLLNILLGEKWLTAAPILSILAISSFILALTQYNQLIMYVKNKPHWQFWMTSLYAVTNIMLFIVFARQGLLALATAFTARSILFFPLSSGVALYLLDIKITTYLKIIFPSLFSSIAMYLALVGMKPFLNFDLSVLNILMNAFIGAVIYFLSYACLDRHSLVNVIRDLKTTLKG